MKVQIVKTGRRTVTVNVPEGASVKDALRQGETSAEGFTIAVGGSPASLDSKLNDGDIVQLVGKVKGGSGSINVRIVKIGKQTKTATVKRGATIEDALKAVGYEVGGDTISLNGRPAQVYSRLDSSTDIIQLVPNVKGGN